MNNFLEILPNLGVGVAAVGGIVLSVRYFINALEKRATEHAQEMREREEAFRGLEKEIRTTLVSQLVENTRAMERVVEHLNAHRVSYGK